MLTSHAKDAGTRRQVQPASGYSKGPRSLRPCSLSRNPHARDRCARNNCTPVARMPECTESSVAAAPTCTATRKSSENSCRTYVERNANVNFGAAHRHTYTHAQQYLPRFRVPKVDRCLFSRDDPLVIRDEMLPQSHGRYWRRVFLHGRCCYLRVLHGDINVIEHRSSAAICCGEYVLVVLCSSNIDRVFLPARWLAPLSFASLTVSVCALTRAVCRV